MKTSLFWILLAAAAVRAERTNADAIRASFGELSVEIVAEGKDLYKLEIAPRSTANDASSATTLRSPGGETRLTVSNGWIEVRRGNAPDDSLAWRGTILPVSEYGRAAVPGTRVEWNAPAGEAIYGLGQRFTGLNQAGKVVEMWNRDAPGQGEVSYFCSPVLFSSAGYALFAADNPEGEFSLNPQGEGANRYTRAGRSWTLYLAIAPTLKEQVQMRASVQGPFRGAPDWAWGPWISRNSYENQGEAEDAINGMVARGLPVSAIVQEAWKGSSSEADFNNFSKDRWPNLDAFFALCAKHDIKNVLWQVPVYHPTSPDFAEAERRGFFVKKPDGSVSWRKEWLEGFANIDFTNPDAVRWWQDQMRDEIRRGVRGFKADDGEDIKADDVFFDGRRGWQMHNEYSALYARALFQLFDEEKADGMLWCRSASLGCEQTPAVWAGDQFATWPQYRSLLSAGLSAGLSGSPFWGHDIGGYIGDPTPELYIRWLQFGAFSPFMQYHGIQPREPWRFGFAAEQAYRLLANVRMNLRPTLKALGHEAERTGLPLMRPMAMEFPDDPRFLDENTQYMLGPNLLVAPVLNEDAVGRRIKFPAGRWQHLLKPIAFQGPAEINVPIDLVDAPVFVRENAALLVELPTDAQLGSWDTNAPVRELRFDAVRPILSDIHFPPRASTLAARAEISFRIRSGYTGTLAAYSAPADDPDQRTALEIAADGDSGRIVLHCPDSREADMAVEIRDESGLIFSGTVQWRSPVTLEAKPHGSRVAREGSRTIESTIINHSDDTLSLRVAMTAESGAQSDEPPRDISLPPHDTWSGEWQVKVVPSEEVSDSFARFTVTAGDQVLDEARTSFVHPLRMAAVGPFPAREKEAFRTPFPPEWTTSANNSFRVGDHTVRWVTIPTGHQEQFDGIDFEALWGQHDHAAGYAMAKVKSDRARKAELRIGSDDTITAWLNGELIFAKEVYRLSKWDQEIVPVELAAGENLLVFKVAQDRNPWRLQFHLTGPDGGPLVGVTDIFDADAYRSDREATGPIIKSPKPLAWHIAGPFAWNRSNGLTSAGAQDALASLAEPLAASGITWRTTAQLPNYDGTVPFLDLYGEQQDVDAYAVTVVNVEKPTPAILRCGSDDGIVIWLNGKTIHAAEKPRAFKDGEDTVHATLEPGRNLILCRVRQGGGDWRFRVELWDASQRPLRPLATP